MTRQCLGELSPKMELVMSGIEEFSETLTRDFSLFCPQMDTYNNREPFLNSGELLIDCKAAAGVPFLKVKFSH